MSGPKDPRCINDFTLQEILITLILAMSNTSSVKIILRVREKMIFNSYSAKNIYFVLLIVLLHYCNCKTAIWDFAVPYNTSLIHNITRVLDTILLKQDRNFRPINGG
ncbi:unnamed protein product [Gongylonema pulchrum]|uniref:Secreted protein n=1 Tax=Gongylonema pulchrum TaxID=637853 RepID=A0A183D686_9BILA|nr:unnamed protein product [Gongylonema pulchrum]